MAIEKRDFWHWGLMILTVLLINVYFTKELGNWRYIGLLGFMSLGFFFNTKHF